MTQIKTLEIVYQLIQCRQSQQSSSFLNISPDQPYTAHADDLPCLQLHMTGT